MKIYVKFFNKILEVDDSSIFRYFPKKSVEGRHKVDKFLREFFDFPEILYDNYTFMFWEEQMKGYKTLFLILVFLPVVIMSSFSGQKRDVMESDYYTWNDWSTLAQLTYLEGFLCGANAANKQLSAYGMLLDGDIKKKYEKLWDKISLFDVTVGQLRDGIEKLYEDFSNSRIKIVDAVYIVDMQIRGKNPELIAAQIRYLKMQPIDKEAKDESHRKYLEFWNKHMRYPNYKELSNGKYSKEDLLKGGWYVDSSNEIHNLFCYGEY